MGEARLDLASLDIGDILPPVSKAPISRTTLALFAGASNDHNPMHIDIDVARAAGMDDVFAQGMLIMAYLGQFLTGRVPQSAIRTFGVRFSAITHLKSEITCSGKVVDKVEQGGETRVHVDLTATDQIGDVKLIGRAVFVVS